MTERIELILIDIDDCLLPTDGKFHPDYFFGLPRIARRAERANEGEIPPIGFCTGRDRNYVEAVAFSIGRPNSWSVIESGVALFNPTTKELLINPVLTLKVRETFEKIRQERLPQILKKFPGLFDYPGNMINIALERKYGVELSIEECYLAVKEELNDLENQGLLIVHHSKIAVDISPKDINKASGIKFLAEKTGIEPSEMLGIGDSQGDFSMLEMVGWAGCPDNASTECKHLIQKKGGHVSKAEYVLGIEDVIQHFTSQGD